MKIYKNYEVNAQNFDLIFVSKEQYASTANQSPSVTNVVTV